VKIPLLEYLDKLEARAQAALKETAPSTTWLHDVEAGRIFVLEASKHRAVAATMYGRGECADHIVATQPKATLALIAKLREAIEYVRHAVSIAATKPSAEVLNDFQDDVVRWACMEVPE
jgi:hypothetical protein